MGTLSPDRRFLWELILAVGQSLVLLVSCLMVSLLFVVLTITDFFLALVCRLVNRKSRLHQLSGRVHAARKEAVLPRLKRSVLKKLASVIASELEQKPYDYWTTQEFPITYETKLEGKDVQVEIDRLELEDDYVHLSVSVDTGWGWSAFSPPGTSVIIRKEPDT